MKTVIQCLAALPGVVLLLIGISILTQPEQGLDGLGLAMQSGLGLSTQIGDMAAFFFGTSIFIFYGAFRPLSGAAYAGALMLILAALFRLVATLHGAPVGTQFIVFEVVSAIWIVALNYYLRRPR